MTTILWQSRSPVVYGSFQKGELVNAANGGNAYDFQAIKVLAEKFRIDVDKSSVKKPGENLFQYWWRMRNHLPQSEVFIMEPFPLIFGKRPSKSKSIAVIHHIDDQGGALSLKHRWFFSRLKKQLTKIDLVITVSTYWEAYLKELGCNNVKVIYNAFNPSEYQVSQEAIARFKKQHGFNDEQPLIYLGNASRQKGVYEAYEALKDLNYQLVMSGMENRAADLPVKFLNLKRSDYITLLNAADVVVTMSKLTEGWNRIAHEALLCKTPVIGSGTGGMQELLQKAGQGIIIDPSQLTAAVQTAIANKNTLGTTGYSYASQFDQSYFEREWIQTLTDLIKK